METTDSNEVDGAVDQAVVEYINNEKVIRVDSREIFSDLRPKTKSLYCINVRQL